MAFMEAQNEGGVESLALGAFKRAYAEYPVAVLDKVLVQASEIDMIAAAHLESDLKND
jgi:hypothetical protein